MNSETLALHKEDTHRAVVESILENEEVVSSWNETLEESKEMCPFLVQYDAQIFQDTFKDITLIVSKTLLRQCMYVCMYV